MGLSIKNHETEQLVRRLVDRTGESVTGAITVAVRERLERLTNDSDPAYRAKLERVRRIARDAAPRWKEPYRSADHGDLLYDERGLPR
ncbi:MAG TPA: type II toxin-antitoxin system VapB family antitoxin [Candidatus Dormibacteraeota bacterium]|nr:type II toxin-antitoxin system VapB family antitoxin [Candidatus Dormibacteraeota bacterium]